MKKILFIICSVKSAPNDALAAEARVMTIPAAIDIKRDGSWDARPSQIVNTVYFHKNIHSHLYNKYF